MTEEFIRNRITELRLRRGVSEYQMSYDLGHSRGYVYNISSGKALPPMKAVFQWRRIAPGADPESARRYAAARRGRHAHAARLHQPAFKKINRLLNDRADAQLLTARPFFCCLPL